MTGYLTYTKIENSYLRSTEISSKAKLVGAVLKTFDPCYPSYSKISLYTGIKSPTTINSAIRELERLNIILITKGRSGKANEYVFRDFEDWSISINEKDFIRNVSDLSKY